MCIKYKDGALSAHHKKEYKTLIQKELFKFKILFTVKNTVKKFINPTLVNKTPLLGEHNSINTPIIKQTIQHASKFDARCLMRFKVTSHSELLKFLSASE